MGCLERERVVGWDKEVDCGTQHVELSPRASTKLQPTVVARCLLSTALKKRVTALP